MHNTGIYSWQYLRELGDEKLHNMVKYVRSLKRAGKSRHPLRSKARRPRRGGNEEGGAVERAVDSASAHETLI